MHLSPHPTKQGETQALIRKGTKVDVQHHALNLHHAVNDNHPQQQQQHKIAASLENKMKLNEIVAKLQQNKLTNDEALTLASYLETAATGDSWFKSLSPKQQAAYKKLHPRSKIGKTSTSDSISQALEDEHHWVREDAIQHPKATPEHITKALKDDSADVREAAKKAQNKRRGKRI